MKNKLRILHLEDDRIHRALAEAGERSERKKSRGSIETFGKRAAPSGCTFIAKPAFPAELLHKIRHLLDE